MSVEIADIRAGLVTNLKTVSGSRQVSAYPLKSVTPPSLFVFGFGKIVRTGFGTRVGGGSFEIPFIVQGVSGLATDKSAHIVLERWLSPTGAQSIWNVIESDKTLGGKVSSLAVTECDGAQYITIAPGVEMLGSTWHVQIEL